MVDHDPAAERDRPDSPTKVDVVIDRLSFGWERIGEAVFLTDRDGTILYVNGAFERVTGFARGEAIGRSPRILRSDEHDDAFFRRMWTTILAGREYRGRIHNRRKDGREYWSEQTITPIPGPDGAPTHFVSVLRDVTGREEALRGERAFTEVVLATVGHPVLVTAPDSRVVRCNPACRRLSGYPRAGLLDCRLLDHAVTEPDRDRWAESFERAIRDGELGERELAWRTYAGETRHVMWSFRTLPEDAGYARHVILSGIDVTEHRQALRILEDSEVRYRRVVENLHEGLWMIDDDDKTTFVNEQMATMLGYTVDEMIGQSVFRFMDEAGRRQTRRNLERRRRGITEDHEFALTAKDGTTVETVMQASPIFDADGLYRGALAGVLDIGQRKRFERALREARDELERRVAERTSELREALEEVSRLKDRLEAENILLREEVDRERSVEPEIVGDSTTMRRSLRAAERVARTGSTVLLFGETGTGKGLVARAIHARSPLADAPLVTVDCTALPPTLIESELFGHERGAFTGATRERPGRFEMADGGTIFLDEVGDLPMEIQSKLLRVLQDGEFERVGSSLTRTVQVRIIAATHRDLAAMVRGGTFRSDLYYRLSVFPIRLPALRERPEDIPALVRHILVRRGRKLGVRVHDVTGDVLDLLCTHDWPGNVRELENVLERAMITSTGGRLNVEDLRTAIGQGRRDSGRSDGDTLADHDRRVIVDMLERCEWRIKGEGNAADRLGLPPSTLRDRMRKLGIRRT